MTDNNSEFLKYLLGRCRLGDQDAFRQLYELTSARLTGLAYRIVQNTDTANEILQEAFVQIWQRAADYQSDLADPMTWLSSIVRYRAYDRIRAEKRRIESSPLADSCYEQNSLPEEEQPHKAEVCDLKRQIDHCIELLDESHRRSILLAYYHGMSRNELANYFNTPVNTVKSWLRRGIMRLQQCLQD